MSNGEYKPDLLRFFTTQELIAALENRREKLQAEQKSFYELMWPKRKWCEFAPFVVPLIYLVILGVLVFVLPAPWFGDNIAGPVNFDWILTWVFGLPILLFLSLACLFIKKDRFLRKEFEAKHPDAKILLTPHVGR